jgi:hypothetical protein
MPRYDYYSTYFNMHTANALLILRSCDDNGMCSHMCFPLPAYESTKTGWMCPDFFLMEADNKTCTEIGMYNVITLVRHHLYKPNLNLTDCTCDFSCTGEYKTRIYHTDKIRNHAISSVRKDHSQRSPYLVQLNDNLQDS